MNNQYIKIIIAACLLAVGLQPNVQAQDAHYSQFYMSPLMLNPALTGHIEGKWRVNVNYKRQWSGVTSSGVYNTPSLSFDINLRKNSTSKHSFGVGVGLLNDLSGAGNKLTNLTAIVGGAAHLGLDGNEKHFLSLGLGVGIANRRLKTQEMLFASQYDGEMLNPGISNGENFTDNSFLNVETRGGLVYAFYPTAKTNIKVGATVLHPLQMAESILNQDHNRSMNFAGHLEINHIFNAKIGIQPYLLYMTQAKAIEITAGANVSFMFGEENSFFLGGGYRIYDGAIAVVGMEFKRARLGLSYDIATTDLGQLTNGKGDIELSFQYIGITKEPKDPVLPALRYF